MNAMRLFAPAVLAIALVGCGQKVELSSVPAPGSYVVVTETQMSQKFHGGPADGKSMDTQMTMHMRLDVGEADASGRRDMTVTFERIRQQLVVEGRTTAYDSAKPDEGDEQLARVLGALAGASLRMTVDADGKLVDAEGLDALWDRLAEKHTRLSGVIGQMKAQLGDEAIGQMVVRQNRMMPDEPVGTGDTWTGTMTLKLPMIGEQNYRYRGRVTDIDHKAGRALATIAFEGVISSNEDGAVALPGAPTRVELLGMEMTQSGTMLYDAQVDMATAVDMTQKGTVRMRITLPDGEPVEMTVEQEASTKMTAHRAVEP
ncbi:MAG: DUF6263 family protein [Planctomycetota bacterium]